MVGALTHPFVQLPSKQSSHEIAERIVRTYLLLGTQAEVAESSYHDAIVVIPSLRRIELVTNTCPTPGQVKVADGFLSDGLDVWFVIPQADVAESHSAVRGHASMLQGYWTAGGKIRFEHPRRA